MPYKLRTIFTLILLFACVTLVPARAQRVGLVLSGGGAKGLYHVGVIRALEENAIPIDYVAGTSMGSIVAGMYAAGYTPEDIAVDIQRSVQPILEAFSLILSHKSRPLPHSQILGIFPREAK